MSARPAWTGTGVLLAVAGGLALAGAATSAWSRVTTTREVAGVELPAERITTGMELAPEVLPLGLVAAVIALGLLVARARLRRLLAALLLLVGLAAAAAVAAGIAQAEGDTAAGAVVALAGGVLVAGSAVMLLRPAAAPRLPARYDLDAPDDGDEEWRLAGGEAEEPGVADADGGDAPGTDDPQPGERDGRSG